MSTDGRTSLTPRGADWSCDPRQLLRRLTDAGIAQADGVGLILAHPNHQIARALDALELLGRDCVTDVPGWIGQAVRDSQMVDAVLSRQRGWQNWNRLHQAWDAADAAYHEQQRRSRGWAAAVSSALDDEQLARAVQKVTRPVGALGRRSLPVVRAQLLAWAVAVHGQAPTSDVGPALVADLGGIPAAADPLEHGLPAPPAGPASRDDLSARLAAVIAQHQQIDPVGDDRPQSVDRSPPQPGRVVERALQRGA